MKTIRKYLSSVKALLDFLKKEDIVYVQPHNFPDHDAIASAFALQQFFIHHGIPTEIVFDTEIQRDAVKRFIEDLNIHIHHISEVSMHEHHKIVLVDGCKGNTNVTDLIGDEVGVIDHHLVVEPDDVEFSDIRMEYGACASIVASYYIDHHVDMSRDVATALMIGINMDTALLTRNVSEFDMCAYFHCYRIADIPYVNSILRNYIRLSDLDYYQYLITHLKRHDRVLFCYFPQGCNQNLLGILSDFALALEEIDLVMLCANDQKIHFSLRSETLEWDVSTLIRQLLSGVGFGGGHADMAGGIIPNAKDFDPEKMFKKIIQLLYADDQP
ncbi:MAG: DHH family phosphoesterase [Candidatus Magnetomorum sp.]|nr:DHH family phosphoesterase [Candidatus Magnetomorum sp.]